VQARTAQSHSLAGQGAADQHEVHVVRKAKREPVRPGEAARARASCAAPIAPRPTLYERDAQDLPRALQRAGRGRQVGATAAVTAGMDPRTTPRTWRPRIAAIAAAVLIAGCAAAPTRSGEPVVAGAPSAEAQQAAGGGDVVRIRWHVAPLAEINRICNAGMPAKFRKSVWGCYRRAFDQCVIYTADEREDPNLHDTIGHEVRHCFQGAFHR